MVARGAARLLAGLGLFAVGTFRVGRGGDHFVPVVPAVPRPGRSRSACEVLADQRPGQRTLHEAEVPDVGKDLEL